MFAGCTTGEVIRTPPIPLPTMISASPIVAQQMPMAPASICNRAMRADLCVLACGRSAIPARRQWSAMRAMFASRISRSRTSAGVTSFSRDPGTPTSAALGNIGMPRTSGAFGTSEAFASSAEVQVRAAVGSDSDRCRYGLDIREREAEPTALVFLERFEHFELELAIACELRAGLVFDAAFLCHAQHPLLHPRDVPLLVLGELVENFARQLIAVAARGVFGVTRNRTFFDDHRQREQVDDVRGKTDRLAEPALVAVGNFDRHSPELPDPFRPQPCVTGLVGDVPRKKHLRFGVLLPLGHLHQKRCATDLGISIEAEDLDQRLNRGSARFRGWEGKVHKIVGGLYTNAKIRRTRLCSG